jgi:hypothetical protein
MLKFAIVKSAERRGSEGSETMTEINIESEKIVIHFSDRLTHTIPRKALARMSPMEQFVIGLAYVTLEQYAVSRVGKEVFEKSKEEAQP